MTRELTLSYMLSRYSFEVKIFEIPIQNVGQELLQICHVKVRYFAPNASVFDRQQNHKKKTIIFPVPVGDYT